MGGFNLVQIQDIISAYIKAEFPDYQVYDDVVLDDEYVYKIGNKVKPYIVIQYGSLSRSTTANSFAGVRHDEYSSFVDVSVVAPTPNQARRASNIIVDNLIGWKPTTSTTLIPMDGMELWASEDSAGRPFVYICNSRFGFQMNTENIGSYITP
jgi:hypothetical protein